jgi:hypothetical protein
MNTHLKELSESKSYKVIQTLVDLTIYTASTVSSAMLLGYIVKTLS